MSRLIACRPAGELTPVDTYRRALVLPRDARPSYRDVRDERPAE